MISNKQETKVAARSVTHNEFWKIKTDVEVVTAELKSRQEDMYKIIEQIYAREETPIDTNEFVGKKPF